MPTTGIVHKGIFGTTADGTLVEVYALRNSHGMEAHILTYGGIVQSLQLPDKKGRSSDVVLGYDNFDGYRTNSFYFGALIGRYGNRIGKGRFTLNGRSYTLATNNGPNHLHGGLKGFDKVVWAAKPVDSAFGPGLELTYLSPDGEEGYPGNLEVTAVYVVTEQNELRLQFTATADKNTFINLTHHSYFNLAGQGNGDILDHIVFINADRITPVDRTLIPTGELGPVTGTPFDFLTPTAIGARINNPDTLLQYGSGYDHNWVLNKAQGELALAARVAEPTGGRVMEVYTTSPGLQFYTGNFLDGSILGKRGVIYQRRSGFCMEPQHFPDSPNHPNFPTTELKPGEIYQHTLAYKFS